MADGRRPSRQVRRAEARKKLPERKSFRLDRLVAPLLVAAGLFAYHNALRGPFVLDDLYAIQSNQTIRTLWPPWGALSPPAHSAVTGRPLVNLSLAFNYALHGLDVTSYHGFNLTAHILSALVLFGIVLRTLRSPDLRSRYRVGAVGIATAAALLWVVHPLTTESVDYTIQRTELLMGLFFLLTLYFALRGFETPERWGWHAAALAAFALGLGSKEVIAVAPAVVLAYDRLFWSTSFKEALRRRRLLYGGFAVVLVLFVLVVGARFSRTFTAFVAHEITPWQYGLTESGVILHYLCLALWPDRLAADYAGWPIATSAVSVLPSLIAVGALFALTVWGLVRQKKIAFLGVFFFLVLAPTSSFRPMPAEVAAERRMYLPLAAVVLLFVLAGHTLLRRVDAPRAAGRGLVAVLAVVLALVTVRRNEDYRTTLSFWSDIVAKRPDNPRARMWLGNYLYEHGKRAEAYEHLATAVRLQPKDAQAQYGLGVVLASQGRTDEAIERYRTSLLMDPQNAAAHNNLGIVLAARRQTEEAIEHYLAAIRIDPAHAGAHYNLALILADRVRMDEAIGHLEAALRLKPDFPEARRALDGFRSRANQ
jgi:tetratricopeptide (TPR) repeat protein